MSQRATHCSRCGTALAASQIGTSCPHERPSRPAAPSAVPPEGPEHKITTDWTPSITTLGGSWSCSCGKSAKAFPDLLAADYAGRLHVARAERDRAVERVGQLEALVRDLAESSIFGVGDHGESRHGERGGPARLP